jgi:tetratricopeptide (TPR) repeat protein
MVPADKLRSSANISIIPLSAGEREMLPYRIVSARGVNREQALKLVTKARPVADRYPADAAVQRALAEMEFDAGELDRSDAAADRALAADPQNLMAMVYKGRVAGKRAVDSGNAADWKAARSWFLRANRVKPDYALPLVLYYDTFVAANEPVPQAAVDALGAAVVIAPADGTLRARMGIELIKADKLDLARLILSPVAFDPEGPAENPLAELMAELKAGAGREALLAKATKLKADGVNEFTRPFPGFQDDESGKDSENDKEGEKAKEGEK